MALDWSKEISFAGLRQARPKPKDVYPTKRYMNLAVADKKTVEVRNLVQKIIVLVVVVVLFLKFAVFDFVFGVSTKQAELAQKQAELAQVESQLVGYDEVLAEYSTYESARMGNDGINVPTLDALALVDDVVRPVAEVTALEYDSNQLTLTLANASLGTLGELLSVLQDNPIVADVSVANSAAGQSGSGVVLTSMTITLQVAGDAQ